MISVVKDGFKSVRVLTEQEQKDIAAGLLAAKEREQERLARAAGFGPLIDRYAAEEDEEFETYSIAEETYDQQRDFLGGVAA